MVTACAFYFQGYQANIVTIDFVTPLHEACSSGHVACVRALIRAGADVNIIIIIIIIVIICYTFYINVSVCVGP